MSDKHTADGDHQEFFEDVRDFMAAGGRNTAADGAKRDLEIHQLKMRIWELENRLSEN